jgi:NADPH:quinone reductase-like Zn-dependent oxidoreductase
MKAWIKREGRLDFSDVPLPTPNSGELLIRVQAISLNRGEIRAVARAAEGTVPGWDVAGTVVSTARDGHGPPEGARVACLLKAGGWAEFAAVPAGNAAVIPASIELEVAATLPVAALTVVRAFAVAGSVVGKRLLVTGGAGGVGQFATQLGSIAGATVTAVTSRDSQRELLHGLGARDVVPSIDDATGPYDFILESVGGSSLATAIDLVARDGLIVTIGNSSEQETTFNARTLYAKGAIRIYALLIFEEMESRRVGAADLERLLALVADGKLRAPVEVRRGWRDLPLVLDELESRQYSGKAVLQLD